MSDAVEKPVIQRADGEMPKGYYLYPSESWWLGQDLKKTGVFSGRWNFGYVELMDGRFCVEGFTRSIRDDDEGGWATKRRNNFPSRNAVIRAGAARLILVMRGSRKWEHSWDSLNGEWLKIAINWVLATVARETGATKPPRLFAIGPHGLADQLAAAGYSRKWIRQYLLSNFPQPKAAPDEPYRSPLSSKPCPSDGSR